MELTELERQTFVPLVGESFKLKTVDGRTAVVTLSGVSSLRGAHQEREPFSLLFQGPGGELFPQQTFTLEHDGTGALALFMVPVGKEEDRILYEAIVS